MPNTAVSYAEETTMLLSGHISIPAKYCTCTSIRVYLSFSERNHEWLVFRHSLTHRWSRRRRRKYDPPTMRFSWCLVELELKYTSKTPNTVGYIRRMRPIDFSEQQALRRDLLFAGDHTNKKRTKQNENKDTHPSKNCWRLKEKYRSRSSRDMNTFLPYNCCSLSCGDPFVTHHLYVKLDFILGQTNLLLQLERKFQW